MSLGTDPKTQGNEGTKVGSLFFNLCPSVACQTTVKNHLKISFHDVGRFYCLDAGIYYYGLNYCNLHSRCNLCRNSVTQTVYITALASATVI